MEKENIKRDRWLSFEEEEQLLKACPSWLEKILVFALNTGMRRGEILRRVFLSALTKAGIEDFRFHDLRYTFATRLVQAGVDFYKVQRLLGHKTPSMTQRYAHHYPESLRDGVEILDKRENFVTILTQSPTVTGGCSL
ncbi:MAG: site-specific integrase [Nitrospiria bacterium]